MLRRYSLLKNEFFCVEKLSNFHACNEDADFLGKILTLRKFGYRKIYDKDALPYSIVDFISDHYAIFYRGELVAAVRMSSLRDLKQYEIELPLLDMSRSYQDHYQSLVELIKVYQENIIYSSAFVIAPHIRSSEISKAIKEIVGAIKLEALLSGGGCIVAGGTPRFKTDILLERYGYERMQINNKNLCTIPKMSLKGEDIILMKMDSPSSFIEECYLRRSNLLKSKKEELSSLVA